MIQYLNVFFMISTRTCGTVFILEAGCATITGSIPGAPPPARCSINVGW